VMLFILRKYIILADWLITLHKCSSSSNHQAQFHPFAVKSYFSLGFGMYILVVM